MKRRLTKQTLTRRILPLVLLAIVLAASFENCGQGFQSMKAVTLNTSVSPLSSPTPIIGDPPPASTPTPIIGDPPPASTPTPIIGDPPPASTPTPIIGDPPPASTPTPIAVSYNGQLTDVICDVKRPLGNLPSVTITTANYRTILNGLKTNLGCNTIRVYIDTTIMDPSQYPALYKSFYSYAHDALGLKIYANPLNTGVFFQDAGQWSKWVSDYANYFKPDYIGPFNESNLPIADYIQIADTVRSALQYSAKIVGPDFQKTQSTIQRFAGNLGLADHFDIMSSHNANDDQYATASTWSSIQQLAGKATWASENPRAWSVASATGQEIGIQAVVNSPISGLVIYLAYPSAVDINGQLTATGAGIAAGIVRGGAITQVARSVPVQTSCAEPAVASSDSYTLSSDIVYKKANGVMVTMDIYVPKNVVNPSIVMQIHGGAWKNGSKTEPPEVRQAQQLVAQGFAVAAVNYRMIPDNLYPIAIKDVFCAVKFLKGQASTYGFNGAKIGVVGHSAGAHLAAMIGTAGSQATDPFGADGACLDRTNNASVQAVAAYYVPSNFLDLVKPPTDFSDASDTQAVYNSLKNLVIPFMGVDPTDPANADAAALASPVLQIVPSSPPFFVAHGTSDGFVPGTQQDDLVIALGKMGIPVNHFELQDFPHGFYPFDSTFNATLVSGLQAKGQVPASLTPSIFDARIRASSCTMLSFLKANL